MHAWKYGGMTKAPLRADSVGVEENLRHMFHACDVHADSYPGRRLRGIISTLFVFASRLQWAVVTVLYS